VGSIARTNLWAKNEQIDFPTCAGVWSTFIDSGSQNDDLQRKYRKNIKKGIMWSEEALPSRNFFRYLLL